MGEGGGGGGRLWLSPENAMQDKDEKAYVAQYEDQPYLTDQGSEFVTADLYRVQAQVVSYQAVSTHLVQVWIILCHLLRCHSGSQLRGVGVDTLLFFLQHLLTLLLNYGNSLDQL